jgi:hypothetical protein
MVLILHPDHQKLPDQPYFQYCTNTSPTPIAIDNGLLHLPHITFDLSLLANSGPILSGLMDTCGALNTGYMLFHQWLMSQYHELVAKYTAFNKSKPFEPVKLGGANRDSNNFQGSTHGNLTTIICYFTPYHDLASNLITSSLALGHDVTAKIIFGLPLLCNLNCVISLGANLLQSSILNCTLPITCAAAHHCLPTQCSFNTAPFKDHHTAALTGSSADPSHQGLTIATAIATDNLSSGYL